MNFRSILGQFYVFYTQIIPIVFIILITGAEFLYLPLEVEVTSQPGIYSPQDVIDFGLVPTQSEPKSVKILLLNSGSKAIQIQSVIATPVTEAINVNFKPLKVQPEILRPKVIAEMVFNRKSKRFITRENSNIQNSKQN